MTPSEIITFDMLPEAVGRILCEVERLTQIITQQNQVEVKTRELVGIDEAAIILRKSRSTIYKLVGQRKIPSYKAGKQLYFYEDELIQWVEGGRRQTCAANIADIAATIGKHQRARRK